MKILKEYSYLANKGGIIYRESSSEDITNSEKENSILIFSNVNDFLIEYNSIGDSLLKDN